MFMHQKKKQIRSAKGSIIYHFISTNQRTCNWSVILFGPRIQLRKWKWIDQDFLTSFKQMKIKKLLGNLQQLLVDVSRVVLVLLVNWYLSLGLTIEFIGRTPRPRIPARSKTKFYVKQQTWNFYFQWVQMYNVCETHTIVWAGLVGDWNYKIIWHFLWRRLRSKKEYLNW